MKRIVILFYLIFQAYNIHAKCDSIRIISISTSNDIKLDTFTYLISTNDSFYSASAIINNYLSCEHLTQNHRNFLSGKMNGKFQWVYFKIKNPYVEASHQIIEMPFSLDSLVLYELKDTNIVKTDIITENINFNLRKIIHPECLFDIRFDTLETKEFLMLINMEGTSFRAPISIMPVTKFIEKDNKKSILIGVYFGIILFILLASLALLIFFGFKKVILFYAIYVCLSVIYIADSFGYAFQYIFPNFPQIEKHFTYINIQGLYLALVLFTNEFFENTRFKLLLKVYFTIVSMSILSIFLNLIKYDSYYYFQWTFTVVLVTISCLISLIIPIANYSRFKIKSILFVSGNLFIVIISFYVSYSFIFNFQISLTTLYLPTFFHLLECIMVLTIATIELIKIDKAKINFQLNWLRTQKENLKIQNERNQVEKLRQNELLEYQKELIIKQEQLNDERTRIASEMHDDLGSGLTTIRYLSDRALKNANNEAEKSQIEKIANQSNALIRNMSEIIWAMNSRFDTLENLISYIRRYSSEYLEEYKIQLEWSQSGISSEAKLSGEKRRNVFLVVKEALHNIVKHSQAKQVKIEIKGSADHVLILIQDNGIGFDMNGSKSHGNGLFNMQKRMQIIGGSYEIKILQPGTQVSLTFETNDLSDQK